MLNTLHKKQSGFTLVEIMIVVAIIALLAAVAVPSFLRARKRSQATSVKEDLRMIDAAVDQYAIENNKAATVLPTGDDLKGYVKAGTRLQVALTGATTTVTDTLGGTITIPAVDALPVVPATTFTSLSDVAPTAFWLPYAPAGS